MSDAIDRAAEAFATDMGVRPAPVSRSSNQGTNKIETIFEEPGFLENPEETAGGDLKPLRVKKADLPKDEDVDPDLFDEEEFGPRDPEEESDNDEDVEEETDEDKDDEDEDEDDPLLAKKFSVTVDGEEAEVSLREALSGYIRQETFHRRLNALKEANDVITTEAQNVAANRDKAVAILREAEAYLVEIIPEAPDWDKVFAEDPANGRKLQKQYETFGEKIREVRNKRIALEKENEEADVKRTEEFAKAEWPKFVRKANWKTTADMKKDMSSMRRTALQEGLTEPEIAQIYDSRFLSILRKASKYDRIMAAKPRPVQEKKDGGKRPNPGAGSNVRTAPKGLNGAQRKLSRTGSVVDAIPVFEQILRSR